MKTSETIVEISKALIAVQGQVKNIGKDSQGYGYNYTSLDKLLDYVRPMLVHYGLAVVQTPTSEPNGSVGVCTRLIHTSGEWIEDTMTAQLSQLAKMNAYQVAGSVITYFRRYAISSMLGIASEDDKDMGVPQQQQGKRY
jgi:hypothetical protein